MKGQNMAVETVFTVGLGVMLATGVVSIFSQYQNTVSDRAADKQSQIAVSNVKNALYTLEMVDSGETTLNLPDETGSREYTIEIGDNISIGSQGMRTDYPVNGIDQRIALTGSAEGGTAKLFKTANQISLVED